MVYQNKSIYVLRRSRNYTKLGLVELLSGSEWFESVLSFGSGEELINQIPTLNPPNIILIDIGLPGIDGIETMKMLLSAWPVSRMLILRFMKMMTTSLMP
ncbi:MAG: response regulator [Saprospiraceae bacterium]|nr:response regulator [Saprospiraceae bacterium]